MHTTTAQASAGRRLVRQGGDNRDYRWSSTPDADRCAVFGIRLRQSLQNPVCSKRDGPQGAAAVRSDTRNLARAFACFLSADQKFRDRNPINFDPETGA